MQINPGLKRYEQKSNYAEELHQNRRNRFAGRRGRLRERPNKFPARPENRR